METTIENEEVAFLSRKILELNKQLMESEKAKTRFLSLIANELNNPMTALLGLVPRLSPEEDDPKYPIFSIVHAEVLLLGSRIENLVAAAEIEGGTMEISHALTSPAALIEEALEEFKYKLRDKEIHVEIENTLSEKIICDPKKLYLILKNLLANACDYGDPKSKVFIRITEEAERVIISITDQGEGPKVQYKPQIFTRFVPRNEGQHGLGLGLSVSRELCELLDGSIDYSVDERSVTFTVSLPRLTQNADSEACGSNEFLFESFDDALEL
jgi:signal transduction histidine kinase